MLVDRDQINGSHQPDVKREPCHTCGRTITLAAVRRVASGHFGDRAGTESKISGQDH
jgi:hypothetical protein